MIRIEVEVETNDPEVRDYILGDIESWRRTTAKVSESVREEDAWTGGARTVHFSTTTSMHINATAELSDVEEELPAPPRRCAPPRLTTVAEARAAVDFPVYDAPALTEGAAAEAVVQPGGDDVPPSVVVTHAVLDDRGHHRGNVWITSSANPLPTSRFDLWRTLGDRDVAEDRSGGYYRCKVRWAAAATSFVQVESTGHRSLDDVLDLCQTLRAD